MFDFSVTVLVESLVEAAVLERIGDSCRGLTDNSLIMNLQGELMLLKRAETEDIVNRLSKVILCAPFLSPLRTHPLAKSRMPGQLPALVCELTLRCCCSLLQAELQDRFAVQQLEVSHSPCSSTPCSSLRAAVGLFFYALF
jgi:hypothetical protein